MSLSELQKFPEILDGKLNSTPKIHGGLLGKTKQ